MRACAPAARASPPPHQQPLASAAAPQQQEDGDADVAACCLDLALRVLQHLCDAAHHAAATAWAQAVLQPDPTAAQRAFAALTALPAAAPAAAGAAAPPPITAAALAALAAAIPHAQQAVFGGGGGGGGTRPLLLPVWERVSRALAIGGGGGGVPEDVLHRLGYPQLPPSSLGAAAAAAGDGSAVDVDAELPRCWRLLQQQQPHRPAGASPDGAGLEGGEDAGLVPSGAVGAAAPLGVGSVRSVLRPLDLLSGERARDAAALREHLKETAGGGGGGGVGGGGNTSVAAAAGPAAAGSAGQVAEVQEAAGAVRQGLLARLGVCLVGPGVPAWSPAARRLPALLARVSGAELQTGDQVRVRCLHPFLDAAAGPEPSYGAHQMSRSAEARGRNPPSTAVEARNMALKSACCCPSLTSRQPALTDLAPPACPPPHPQAHALAALCVATLRHSPELPRALLRLAAFQPRPQAPWHHPANLGWSQYLLPLLATALLESHPAAAAEVRALHARALKALTQTLTKSLSLCCDCLRKRQRGGGRAVAGQK